MKVRSLLVDRLKGMTPVEIREKLPSWSVAELSAAREVDGMTAYHHLALVGIDIPLDKLNEDVLSKQDKLGSTPMHAWVQRKIHNIPKRFLTEKTLLKANANGETPFGLVVCQGNAARLPEELLTLKNLLIKDKFGFFILARAATGEHFKTIPRKLITEEVLLLRSSDLGEATIFHSLANGGNLAKKPKTDNVIPVEFITKEKFQLLDTNKQTPLHYAAICRKLYRIDNEFLTQDLLAMPDINGNSVFHMAALTGDILSIPKKLLTFENLNRRNNNNVPPFKMAHDTGFKDFLPLYNWKMHELAEHSDEFPAWRALFEEFGYEMPPVLTQSWAKIEKPGNWQEL